MIRVACPHCQRTFRTMTEGMGKMAVCSGCHQAFRIGAARPPFSWKPTSLAEDSWVGVEPPRENREIKHCIMCDAPMEDDAIRCLACGANQITGLVHKPRRRPPEAVKIPVWTMLPIKPLLILAVLVVVGGGIFWSVQWMFTTAVDDGVEMAQVRLIRGAARNLADGMDDREFAEKYAGRVNDENLPRFLEMLEAGDPMIRKAAPPLIACGRVTRIAPIVAKAQSTDQAVASGAIDILEAVGPRRLVQLSNDAEQSVRQPAAEALCLLFEIDPEPDTLAELGEPLTTQEKTETLNRLCRPWPRAVGGFVVKIGQVPGPGLARIEQVGRSFYLQLGSGTFVSVFDAERTFRIPVEQWCAATGVAVNPRQVAEWLAGTVTLTSPYGTGWMGEARVTARRTLTGPPPGFLPIEGLEKGRTLVLPVVLE